LVRPASGRSHSNRVAYVAGGQEMTGEQRSVSERETVRLTEPVDLGYGCLRWPNVDTGLCS
jgi:hypothetical protein